MRILGNKKCPNCGEKVKYLKLLSKNFLWSRWPCEKCKVTLGYQKKRRFIISIIMGIVTIPAVITYLIIWVMNPWFIVPFIISLLTIFFIFEGIELKD